MANDRTTLTSVEREKASVFHSWSAQASINPMMVKDAEGVYVTGEDGTTYLDLSSQLVNTNIGHQHPTVVRAIQEQAATLCTIAPQHGYVSRYRAADQPDRRPASLAQRHGLGRRRALLRSVPLPIGLPRDDRGRGVPARP